MLRVWRSALITILIAGCSSTNGAQDDDEVAPTDPTSLGPLGLNRGEIPVSVRFKRTAEGNWLKGNEAFEDEDFLVAQRYYQYIRTKFPYSRYAAMSEVRIADCQYERRRYLEAIDSYQNFVRGHPGHKEVPYAMYRIGIGYYEQIPGDYILLPPSHEKDQEAVRDAERRLSEYVRRFPNHENAAEAKLKLNEVRGRLMAHERYVADFYNFLDRTRAYVGRLEVIRRDFADVGLDDELLVEIIEAWAEVDEIDKAKDALDQLIRDFPASDNIEDMKEVVQEAEQKLAAMAAAEQADADASSESSDDPEGDESGGTE